MAANIILPRQIGESPEWKESRAFRAWMDGVTTVINGGVVATLLPLHLTDANTVEQYNGVTAQRFSLYNTRTDATNYERLSLVWSANVVYVNTEAAGTGTLRALALLTNGQRFSLGSTGNPVARYTITGPSASIGAGTGGVGLVTLNTGAGGQLENSLVLGIDDAGPYAWAQAIKPGSYFMPWWLQPNAGGLRVGPAFALAGGTVFAQTADVTVANSVVETTMFGAGVGSRTLPANSLEAGRTLRYTLTGIVSGLLSVSIRFRTKIGGVSFADTTAVSSGLTLGTVREFTVIGTFTVRTTGAGGTGVGQARATSDGGQMSQGSKSAAFTAIDTTIANVVDCTVQWGTASPSNSITVTNAMVEVLY